MTRCKYMLQAAEKGNARKIILIGDELGLEISRSSSGS